MESLIYFSRELGLFILFLSKPSKKKIHDLLSNYIFSEDEIAMKDLISRVSHFIAYFIVVVHVGVISAMIYRGTVL